MASSLQLVRRISTSAVKPPPHPRRRCDLALSDIFMLNANYIQKGLLFSKRLTSFTTDHIIHTLKTALSTTLHHFYQLAGRLVTEKSYEDDGKVTGLFIYIDCNGQGAEFIHAIAENITVADVLSPETDVPDFVRSFFPLDGAINYDGHLEPLLLVQFTELVDGYFVGCCFNHVVGDGTSYWNFFNTWAEIARSDGVLSLTPVHDRWFSDNVVPPINLPFCNADEFVRRITPPVYRERMIHFSSESIAKLKIRANQECKTTTGTPISSLQSVGALLWRCITRARKVPEDQKTSCRLSSNYRARLQPPLSANYFGNFVNNIVSTTTAGELLSSSLGWNASLLHQSIAGHTDAAIRCSAAMWMKKPRVVNRSMFDKLRVMLGNSPRFDVYGCDFGWGKAVGARSGGANKFDGMVSLYPGWEGGGSMDLEICLLPECMERLEADEEFLSVVSPAVELDVLLQVE